MTVRLNWSVKIVVMEVGCASRICNASVFRAMGVIIVKLRRYVKITVRVKNRVCVRIGSVYV